MAEKEGQARDRRSRIEIWLTVGAVVIAAFALFVSGWTAGQQRQHNKLSLKPLTVFEWRASDSGDEGAFYLRNYGSGPAIIREYYVELDGEKHTAVWKRPLFATVHEKLGIPDNVKPQLVNFGEIWAVSVGGDQLLYGYKTDQPVPQSLRDDLNNTLKFRFYVCSVYDECEWKKP